MAREPLRCGGERGKESIHVCGCNVAVAGVLPLWLIVAVHQQRPHSLSKVRIALHMLLRVNDGMVRKYHAGLAQTVLHLKAFLE